MAALTLGNSSYPVPGDRAAFTALVASLAELHGPVREQALLFALRAGDKVVASMVGDGKFGTLHLLFEALGRPALGSAGFVKRELSAGDLSALRAAFTPFHAEAASHPNVAFLLETHETPVTALLIARENDTLKQSREYLTARTTALFDLFNDGALRGTDGVARQALLDSFGTLPNRYLSADGTFIVPAGETPAFLRQVPRWITAPPAELHAAAMDKFPSLMSVRRERLFADQNRIVPGVMIRDGVHVGRRNIFMFHAAVNLAAFIGDDNMIDSHASIASAAQIGNKNKIGSFVSLEGVLSPANAVPVVIGNENFLGTFARVGTGILVGDRNFIGAGVNLSLGTKLRDCRTGSRTRGEAIQVRELNDSFNDLAIAPNNSRRDFEGIEIHPGEYILFDNTPDFMKRFEGDTRIRA